jgi:hypothetical protein
MMFQKIFTKTNAKRGVFSILRIYGMLCLALFLLQDFLLYHPSSDPEFAETLLANPKVQTVSLPTDDGNSVGRIAGSGSCFVLYF